MVESNIRLVQQIAAPRQTSQAHGSLSNRSMALLEAAKRKHNRMLDSLPLIKTTFLLQAVHFVRASWLAPLRATWLGTDQDLKLLQSLPETAFLVPALSSYHSDLSLPRHTSAILKPGWRHKVTTKHHLTHTHRSYLHRSSTKEPTVSPDSCLTNWRNTWRADRS